MGLAGFHIVDQPLFPRLAGLSLGYAQLSGLSLAYVQQYVRKYKRSLVPIAQLKLASNTSTCDCSV